jgi:cellulose synthase/poly-beta-1,6-N-acetylglucosamine synthase-like glycosyltransferase
VPASVVEAEIKAAHKPEDKFETVLFLPEGEGRKGEGGLRTQGYFKQSQEGKPLITVVTVVFNGEKFLEETILSVINQTYDNVEYIIIDGGSTDGTLDIIKKYEHAIDYWVSEKDKGIYDAMNKGIDVATGEWINFMNAGDCLLNIPDLSSNENILLVYGKAIIYGKKVLKVKKDLCYADFSGGMIVCHQACFYRCKFVKLTKYDLQYRICADQKLTTLVLKLGQACYFDDVVVSYDMTGISSRNQFEVLKEKILLNKELNWPLYSPVLSYVKAKIVKVREIFNGR